MEKESFTNLVEPNFFEMLAIFVCFLTKIKFLRIEKTNIFGNILVLQIIGKNLVKVRKLI